jgi:hypothetical protein
MSPGTYKFLADALVVFHICFVGFVLLGGMIVLRWRRAMWLHLPAVAWGIYIELSHNICPLTPLENHLRDWGGAATYQGGFVDHYIMPVLYPNGLTHAMQVEIAVLIVVLNAAAYGWVLAGRRIRARRAQRGPPAPTPGTPRPVAAAGGEDGPLPVLASSPPRDLATSPDRHRV